MDFPRDVWWRKSKLFGSDWLAPLPPQIWELVDWLSFNLLLVRATLGHKSHWHKRCHRIALNRRKDMIFSLYQQQNNINMTFGTFVSVRRTVVFYLVNLLLEPTSRGWIKSQRLTILDTTSFLYGHKTCKSSKNTSFQGFCKMFYMFYPFFTPKWSGVQ